MLFYAPNLLHENILPEEESQHAVKVLRLRIGDEVEITNGKGNFCKARITNPHPKHCEFEILSKDFVEKRSYNLHIAIAPTKNIDRLETFVEKAVEIGVDTITPIICRFSERKTIKSERLEKIVISASKQSKRTYFPVLNSICSFCELVNNAAVSQKFIAHCYENEKQTLKQLCLPATDTLLLIGPEGDFSQDEVKLALSKGFRAVSLGNNRLRTETAGIAACATVEVINQ
ncbi:MAG: 16S rRNA (uracil(1498)-N(3))-methyltransferase [Prevotellaceae bacterium]|jgi:16S rRNA (uracil1498-N3)-methyltransferase|nr:16S rRNA (uracil(1498)-N(3))-methyltransferase [Prevotellaceae bacterium]